VSVTGTFLPAVRVPRHATARRTHRELRFGVKVSGPWRATGPTHPRRARSAPLTRVLATEWGRYGITVNTVVPVQSLRLRAVEDRESDEEQRRLERLPCGAEVTRTGTSRIVSFLISEEAGWTTGAIAHCQRRAVNDLSGLRYVRTVRR